MSFIAMEACEKFTDCTGDGRMEIIKRNFHRFCMLYYFVTRNVLCQNRVEILYHWKDITTDQIQISSCDLNNLPYYYL